MNIRFSAIFGPVFFTIGLLIAALFSVSLDHSARVGFRTLHDHILSEVDRYVVKDQRKQLTVTELEMARAAWKYIERNTRAGTGFVDSVSGFPSTTLWDQGSYILGLVSAYKIGLITNNEYVRRVESFLNTLSLVSLFDGKLPNKVYNTLDLSMTDYTNTVVEGGIGWSALDIARLLSALRILQDHSPEFSVRIRKALSSWDLEILANRGEIIGSKVENGHIQLVQEGRIGYEQYAARVGAMWGLDFSSAISARRVMELQEVYGIEVPTDLRRASGFGAITPVLSEPYMLMGLELGLNGEHLSLAGRVYEAQHARFLRTGVPTMVSEDHVDIAPNFVYSSVFSNGRKWAVVSEEGDFYPELRTLSTKAVFAWDAIFDTDYTNQMLELILPIMDPELGWPAGIYEEDGRINSIYTLNTNAIVLQSLYFKSRGPMWRL